ncbi:MAG: Ig-like domain-containing protein [Candidatus Taylorbacteria bacterium]|nr:Ig-like domain-containing protein [Candidatus Taylorbacteria bacterium]
MVVPSSGASTSSVITYSNATGESPVIVTSPGGAGITIGTGKSNVIVTGFTAGQAATGNGNGVIIASTTNITLSYITVPLSHYGINIQGVSPDTIILDHITVVNEDYSYDLYDFATLTTNLTISNCNFAKSIGINNRVSGLTVSSTSAKSLELKGGVTGILNINGLTLSGGTYGLYMASTSILSTGSIIQNTNISGITSHEAFYIIGVTGPLNLLNNTSTNSVDSLNITNSSAITITNFSGSGHTDVNGPDIKVSSSSNIIFNNLSLTGSDKGTALRNEAGSYNIEFNVANISHYFYGVINDGGVHNLSYNNVIVAYIKYLGFMDDQNSGTVHDITYKNSVVHDAGLYFKTHTDVSEQNDGGWAVHYNAYNMYLYNCIAYNNGGSGIGYGNTSSGGVYNSIEYNNGGNWTSTGGINTARSGFYDFQSGTVNTVTGTGWILKNNIGGGSYPVEVYGSNAGYLFNTVDYNLYYPLNTNNFQNLGGIRSWFSYHVTSGSEPNSTNTNPLFTNATNGDFTLTFLSPAIDSGTTYTGMTSTTSDFLGNPIYGTPDMGAYEYQPPYRSGTDKIDPTGNIRIYADGKYRYTTATSGTMSATLGVTHADGTWAYDASTTRPEWLNISNITWGSSKQWTASSSVATTTIFTVGDLTPNTIYKVTVDGATSTSIASTSCTLGICTSGSDGKLILTYTGGWSTHNFAVTPDTTPPTVFLTVPTAGSTVSGSSVTLTATSTDDIGIAGVQFLVDGTNVGSEITSTSSPNTYSTTWNSTGITIYGSHTIYAVARDTSGNHSTSSISVNVDNVAPTMSSSVHDSDTQITVTLSKLANATTITKANNGGFTVTKTGVGTTYAVSSIAPGTDNTKVILTVANMSTAGGTGVTVTYTAGGNGTITDTLGNLLATNGTGIAIPPWNTTAPIISNITSSVADGYYKVGASIDINLTFSKPVNTTGSITVTLNTGGTCTFSGISNSTTASCTYSVGSNENTSRLNVSSVSGTIISTDSNPMTNFAPAVNLSVNKNILIDTISPSVSLDVPSNGSTVSGSAVTLTANASDSSSGLAGIQFKLDNTINIGTESATSPYSITWDSKTTTNASHTLHAVVRDNAGNYSTSTITVTVDNALYSIGGTVSNLSGTLTLQNNLGDNLSLSSNGSFTFASSIASGNTYSVTVLNQPTDQTCTVSNGTGSVSGQNITDVSISCTNNAVTPAPSPITTRSSSGSSASSRVSNLISMGQYEQAQKIANQYNISIPASKLPIQTNPSSTPNIKYVTRNLSQGMTNNDVKTLQIFLNNQGFTIAKSGAGSPGKETNYFGLATKSALMKFQSKYGIKPVSGLFGPVTRKKVGEVGK